MPALTVKNIPDDLYRLLKESAELHRRSLNSEVIVCIERALRSRRVDADELLERARALRAKTKKHPIRDADFSKAKAAGRK